MIEKVMAVFNKPECCAKCPCLQGNRRIYEGYWCGLATNEEMIIDNPEDIVPNQCPLQKYIEHIYICDKKKCDRDMCKLSECDHTTDIKHAINFEQMTPWTYKEREQIRICSQVSIDPDEIARKVLEGLNGAELRRN